MDNNYSNNDIDYAKLIDEAMLSLVKKCLVKVKEHGLFGNHHFYITFLTEFPEVQIPADLKEKYPQEMTIVLQHQFWDLDITDKFFTISLSFNNVRKKLIIPLEAIISFADPSVKFGLQFQYKRIEARKTERTTEIESKKDTSKEKNSGNDNGKVVSLEQFRKKVATNPKTPPKNTPPKNKSGGKKKS